MTTPFPFQAGSVLPAQSLNDITNLPINDQTASYSLVVGDAGKRVVMDVASANTVTVDDSVFTTGDTIFVANKGEGPVTLTEGSGVTINTAGSLVIAQHGGGTLVATSASVFTFFSGGGVNYGVATGGSSSSITVGGKNYTLLTFTSGGTLTVTKAGLFDCLLIGGGGGGANNGVNRSAGGGAGGFTEGTLLLNVDATIVIGAGGAGTSQPGTDTAVQTGATFALSAIAVGGGQSNLGNGGSGGGRSNVSGAGSGGLAVFGQGNNGGGSNGSDLIGGGGGGAGGAGGGAGGAAGLGKEVNTFIAGASSIRAAGGSGAQVLANGTTNFGNGGTFGGNGGSGIAFIRFEV